MLWVPELVILVKHFEGLRLKLYKDVGGIKTIGYGHTFLKSEVLPEEITEQQAEDYLISDLNEANTQVIQSLGVEISLYELSALTSFVFNVGIGNFLKSSMIKKINQGMVESGLEELTEWIFAGGKILKGLVKRRHAELALANQRLIFMAAIMREDRDKVNDLSNTWPKKDELLAALI